MLMMHVYKALFALTASPSDQIYSSCKMRELCVWLCYVVCGMCVCGFVGICGSVVASFSSLCHLIEAGLDKQAAGEAGWSSSRFSVLTKHQHFGLRLVVNC